VLDQVRRGLRDDDRHSAHVGRVEAQRGGERGRAAARVRDAARIGDTDDERLA
jgi:hypothetical protein